jgi:hypothetical protein
MSRVGAVAVCLGVGALLIGGCGGGDDDGGAFGSGSKAKRPATAEELVLGVYGALARNDADAACGLFTPSGEAKLLEGTRMPSCEAAVDAIANQVLDPEAFAEPTVEIDDPAATDLDEWCSTGIQVGWPDGGEVYDRNGPTGDLGAFAYGRQVDGTWAVTDYSTNSCG